MTDRSFQDWVEFQRSLHLIDRQILDVGFVLCLVMGALTVALAAYGFWVFW